jgi:hypothetical protein
VSALEFDINLNSAELALESIDFPFGLLDSTFEIAGLVFRPAMRTFLIRTFQFIDTFVDLPLTFWAGELEPLIAEHFRHHLRPLPAFTR